MATEKQISYINELLTANRNVPYLAKETDDENKKNWIIGSIGMKDAYIDDDTDKTVWTASLYTVEQLETMRNDKINAIEAEMPTMDSKQASAAIDTLKKMLGRR